MRLLIASLLAFTAPIAAQDSPVRPPKPVPAAPRPAPAPRANSMSDLEAEVLAEDLPLDLYLRRVTASWDRAVLALQFSRADSLSTLAQRAIVQTTDLPADSVSWPGRGDWLALRLLAAEPQALEALADDGRWWSLPTSPLLLTYRDLLIDLLAEPGALPNRGLRVRSSTARAMESLRVGLSERLAANGADTETIDLAKLTVDKLAIQLRSDPQVDTPDLAQAQASLNDRADAFLERYPESRFERFVRQEIRLRYRQTGEVAYYFGFGAGRAGSSLGERTRSSISGEVGVGYRTRWLHGAVSVRGSDLEAAEFIPGPDGGLDDGSALSYVQFGVEAGPRLAAGPVAVLPYASGGYVLPPSGGGSGGLAVGYGVAGEVSAPWLGSGGAIRLQAGRLLPQLDGVFDSPVSLFTVGITGRSSRRVRVY